MKMKMVDLIKAIMITITLSLYVIVTVYTGCDHDAYCPVRLRFMSTICIHGTCLYAYQSDVSDHVSLTLN